MVVASKGNDNGGMDFQYHKPPQLTKWQAFKKAIYDKDTHQFLGRTGKSWAQLLLFYAIFYAILAALFAICIQGLFATLNTKEPKWQLDSSLIGINPGLGFRPISDKTEHGSLIWYNNTNATHVTKWVKLIDNFLEPYKKQQTGENYFNCDFGSPPPNGKVCVTSVEKFGPCTTANSYGYKSASPCVFLKLNRIFGWKPDFIKNATNDMPKELQDHIIHIANDDERQQVWISCNGADNVDKERITTINYHPHGFAAYYYPYKNDPNYLSPLVAVELANLTPNVIIKIECRAWANNIEYRSGDLNRAGSVVFEVQVDTAPIGVQLNSNSTTTTNKPSVTDATTVTVNN